MKFAPTAGELFGYYLYNHIHGTLPESHYSAIPRRDVYADEPWKIWSNHQYSEQPGDVYVFTKLKISGNFRIIDREIGTDGGNWQSQDSETEYELVLRSKPPLENDERWIGTRKRFNYNNPNPNFASENGKWILHEFSMRKEGGEDFDHVVCLIRNNDSPMGNAIEAAARRSVLAKKKQKLIEDLYNHSTAAPTGSHNDPLPQQQPQPVEEEEEVAFLANNDYRTTDTVAQPEEGRN